MISQPSKPRLKAPTASLSLVGPRSWLTGPSPRPSDVRCASRRLAEKIQMPKRRRFNSTPVVPACVDAWEPLVHLQLPRQLLFSEPGAEPDTLSQWLWGAWGAGGGIPGLRMRFSYWSPAGQPGICWFPVSEPQAGGRSLACPFRYPHLLLRPDTIISTYKTHPSHPDSGSDLST